MKALITILSLCFLSILLLTGVAYTFSKPSSQGIHVNGNSDTVMYLQGEACIVNMDQARMSRGDSSMEFYEDFKFCMDKHSEFYPMTFQSQTVPLTFQPWMY
jgi:hypothetical protein